MRTNPFYDAWLFLIGNTDEHPGERRRLVAYSIVPCASWSQHLDRLGKLAARYRTTDEGTSRHLVYARGDRHRVLPRLDLETAVSCFPRFRGGDASNCRNALAILGRVSSERKWSSRIVRSLILNGHGYVARLPGPLARRLRPYAVERRRRRRTERDRSRSFTASRGAAGPLRKPCGRRDHNWVGWIRVLPHGVNLAAE